MCSCFHFSLYYIFIGKLQPTIYKYYVISYFKNWLLWKVLLSTTWGRVEPVTSILGSIQILVDINGWKKKKIFEPKRPTLKIGPNGSAWGPSFRLTLSVLYIYFSELGFLAVQLASTASNLQSWWPQRRRYVSSSPSGQPPFLVLPFSIWSLLALKCSDIFLSCCDALNRRRPMRASTTDSLSSWRVGNTPWDTKPSSRPWGALKVIYWLSFLLFVTDLISRFCIDGCSGIFFFLV